MLRRQVLGVLVEEKNVGRTDSVTLQSADMKNDTAYNVSHLS